MTDEELAAIRERQMVLDEDTGWQPERLDGSLMAPATSTAITFGLEQDIPALVAEVARLREERDRLRAALESADGVIRAVQDALGVEADTDAVIAAKTAAAEVARQQGIIDRVRALATLNGQRPYGRSEQGWIGVVSAVALLALLDGEEQS
jgi:PAS domain-containing protein